MMMNLFRTNNFYLGILIGAVMPLLSYVLTQTTNWGILLTNKPVGLFILAGAVNLLLLRLYYRRDCENTARGVIMITFLGLMVLIFTKTITIQT